MGKNPRSILPPGVRNGSLSHSIKARAAQYLPQAIEQGLSAQEYASLAGIGIMHARTELREVNKRLRSQIGERHLSTLQQMQTAAQKARADALANFARVNAIIGKRLTALEKQTAPEATELAALARAIAVAWNGAKDATGLGFAEARASARLKLDDKTPAALVPDVHVEFLDADPDTGERAD